MRFGEPRLVATLGGDGAQEATLSRGRPLGPVVVVTVTTRTDAVVVAVRATEKSRVSLSRSSVRSRTSGVRVVGVPWEEARRA